MPTPWYVIQQESILRRPYNQVWNPQTRALPSIVSDFTDSSLMVPAVIENYSHCSNSVRCEMELRLTPLGSPWWSVIASWLWNRWILSPWLGPAIPTSYRADGCIAYPGNPSGYLRMILCWQAGRVSILFNGKEKGEIRNSAPKGHHYLQIYERWFIELIITPLHRYITRF
jgi:hypothetical protein